MMLHISRGVTVTLKNSGGWTSHVSIHYLKYPCYILQNVKNTLCTHNRNITRMLKIVFYSFTWRQMNIIAKTTRRNQYFTTSGRHASFVSKRPYTVCQVSY